MTSHGPVTRDLLVTFEDVRSRTFARLEGLSDDEYLWEPVPSCMTLRPAADGTYRADPRSAGDVRPAPFTTIGWRMWHIGADCLRGYGRFFGDDPQGDDRHLWPGTAAEGVQELADDWSRFRGHVESLGDDRLLQPMGPSPARTVTRATWCLPCTPWTKSRTMVPNSVSFAICTSTASP